MPAAVILEVDRCPLEGIVDDNNQVSSICINPAFREISDNANEEQDFSEETVSFAESLKTATVSSLKQLLNMYTLQMDGGSSVEEGNWQGGDKRATKTLVSGGPQQLKNKKGVKEESNNSHEQEDNSHMSQLPDALYLEIFSYLSARELCRVAPVCRRWERLSSDNVLWEKKLHVDMRTWHVISHVTNPGMFEECQSEYTSKEVYLRCSPLVNRSLRQQNYGFHQLSSLLRSLLPRRVPRVAMFGPGLEMSTSAIVKKILQDKTGLFRTTGMFPGKFDGVGSGFTMRMEGGESLHLMALYTSTRHEREARRQEQQDERHLQGNRMLQAAHDVEEGDAAQTYELRPAIRELARTLDAVVFVVDASASLTTIAAGFAELKAMLNELWSQPGVPVLVLSCVPEYNSPRASCVNVVQELQLAALNRPWQACDCVVDSLAGVAQAFTWLVQQAQRT